MENFIELNIVLEPSAEAVEVVQKLSRGLAQKEESLFVLDSQNFFPHITLYPLEIPLENKEKIISDLDELSKAFSAVKLSFRKIKTSRGYIGVEFEKTLEIKNIHQAIIEKTNELREGYIKKEYIDSENISKEKKENIQKYGFPSLMNLYDPHLTIIRLKDEKKAEKAIREIFWPINEFISTKLGLYEMGENGTCIEKMGEFKLG